ncbi:MAG: RNA 2',3'-cyclic phosphodiesterase [Bacillota bacterium]|nr:RNA 2',3'-cyclic phosphodiesterase [Bacillota bacterium]
MRLFVACLLPPGLRQELTGVRAALGGLQGRGIQGLKWVEMQNLHVTLKFLGEVEAADVRRVDHALDSCSPKASPFACRVAGIGAFPSDSSLRVLWAGIDAGAEEMGMLAGTIEKALHPLGFPRERRGFAAHITLARARDRASMPSPDDLPPGLSVKMFGEFRVEHFSLMKSDLRPHGPVYSELSSYPLTGRP